MNLKLTIVSNRVKIVNVMTTTSAGLVKGVTTRVGRWCNQLDFFILKMDEFDAILRVDFVVKVNVGIF